MVSSSGVSLCLSCSVSTWRAANCFSRAWDTKSNLDKSSKQDYTTWTSKLKHSMAPTLIVFSLVELQSSAACRVSSIDLSFTSLSLSLWNNASNGSMQRSEKTCVVLVENYYEDCVWGSGLESLGEFIYFIGTIPKYPKNTWLILRYLEFCHHGLRWSLWSVGRTKRNENNVRKNKNKTETPCSRDEDSPALQSFS